jgi:hypothetical protein
MTNQVTYQGETLESLNEQLNYVNEVLNSGFDFEAWEKKEYEEVKKEVEFKINAIKNNPLYNA